jgi:RNA polymerase sigma-70 factor (ECF subfamily)
MVTIGLRTNPAMLLREPRGVVVPGPPRTSPTGETAIVANAIEDPRAFAPLYEHYVDDIHGYCLRRVSDPDIAADLTSQIFIRALSALPKFQSRSGSTSFRSWLFTIAHNLVIDTHRTRRHHQSLDLPDRPIAVHDPAPSPEDRAITADLRTALLAAMDTLTDQQRQIVDLRFAGLTGPEIADVLGLHLAAVKSLQFRAYSRLRILLRDRFDAEFGQGIDS